MNKDWGRTVRCRVSLRKRYGREFTEEEFEEAIEDNTNSYKDGINEKDILQDLLRGDEVWRNVPLLENAANERFITVYSGVDDEMCRL